MHDRLREELEEDIITETAKSESSKMPPPPEDLPAVLDTMMVEEKAEWIGECLKCHSEALVKFQKQAEEKNLKLVEELRKQSLWLTSMKINNDRVVKIREVGFILEQFKEDMRLRYHQAESLEQEAHILQKELPAGTQTTLNIIATFDLWQEYINDKPFFKELIAKYEAIIRNTAYTHPIGYGM